MSRPWLIVGATAVSALFLTVSRPSPEGLMGLGMGNREVRAAPGQSIHKREGRHNLAALEIISTTLMQVQRSYVDPTRIDPKEMLYAALDSVQYNIPEVLVEPNREEDEVTVYVNDKRQTFSTADVTAPWDLSKTLKRIFRFMEANMNPGADLAEVEYAAANGMLSTLDPHSVLLDPEMAREMDVSTKGKFGGLGIVIGMRDKKLTVINPMPNTPASRAGILAKDHIVRINDEVTENLGLDESVQRMRGDAGSKVTLWVEREGQKDLLRFDLVRDNIQVASVESKMLDNSKVGYIKLKQFSSKTTKETKKALKDLKAKGASSYVLDLRWNPGGLLEQAIFVSDLFVDRGTLVTTVGGDEREAHRAERKSTMVDAPLAVLINGSSASASEIVAGALKNLDRAIIIGDTSFGKGSVQMLYDNDNDSKLKLTIAEYLTPGDLSIQGVGITPDVQLNRLYVPKKNDSPGDYVRLQPPSRSYRESDLKASLHSTYARKGERPAAELDFLYVPPKASSEQDPDAEPDSDEIVEDYEMRFARDLLSSIGKGSRSDTLKGIKGALAAPRAEQDKRLHERLAAIGVDWTPAPANQTKNQLKAAFLLEEGGAEIKAGQVVKLTGTVTNESTHPAYRVHAVVRSADPIFRDKELLFGMIPPGESRSWTTHIRVPDAALDRLDYLKFDVAGAADSIAEASPIKVKIVAAERPVFAYSHQIIDQGNGDGLVQLGESHKLRITVRNTGDGVAEDTLALLRNTSGDNLSLVKARFDLGKLEPGESRSVEFAFDVAKRTSDKRIYMDMEVLDTHLGESVADTLSFPIRQASAGPTKASGNIRVTRDATIFEGAAEDSEYIARAAKGTVLRVTGQQGEWLRVELDGKRPGFIRKGDTEKSRAKAKLAGLDSRMQVTPPELQLRTPGLESNLDLYKLAGTVKDDSKVEDVYIFVSNRDAKVDNRKVFYRSNRNSGKVDEMSFDASVPLWPGSNAITVVARENDEVQTVETIFVHRTGNDVTAKAP